MKRKIPHIALLLCVLASCIETFNPEIEEGATNRTLVVGGKITDQEGPYLVRLSSSKPIGLDTLIVEAGATVSIEEENGPTITLWEEKPGVYVTNPTDLRGQVGTKYRLVIRLFDGLEYESSWELLRGVPEIGNISIEYLTKVDNISRRPTGVQLYLDTEDDKGESFYFRWEIIETWQYEAGLVSELVYLGNGQVSPKPEEDFHKVCWKDSKVSNIMTTSVNQLSKPKISKFPLTTIPIDSARFDIRYSALVRQYVMGLKEFEFWKNLRDLNQNLGSLYDKQSFEVTGNVASVNNDSEVVLGYFSAGAVKQKRIFINNFDFPTGFRPKSFFPDCKIIPYREDCGDELICSERSERQILELIESRGETFYSVHSDRGGWDFTPRFCGDCENFGGLASKPLFWEN